MLLARARRRGVAAALAAWPGTGNPKVVRIGSEADRRRAAECAGDQRETEQPDLGVVMTVTPVRSARPHQRSRPASVPAAAAGRRGTGLDAGPLGLSGLPDAVDLGLTQTGAAT